MTNKLSVLSVLFFLVACNSKVTNELPKNDEKLATHSTEDSAKVVSSNSQLAELLSIDKSELKSESEHEDENLEKKKESKLKTATFGAGCFWCIEASFLEVKGITSVKPGYAGGKVKNPSYEQISGGTTGHAEVAQAVYDESIISYDELLEMFWFLHDPTQLNRQGNDVGTQYRSVIFYHDEEQKRIAEKYKKKLSDEKIWDKPIVTEIIAINNYYEAEEYHHNYLKLNPDNAYCRAIVRPKYDKFKKVFGSKLK